jgi:uncharacterized membrane protein
VNVVNVEAGMTLVMIGALLVLGGVVFMAAQPMWRGRLSSVKRPGQEVSQGPGPAGASDTLEPRRAARGLGLKSNWPGLAMIAAGAILLLAGAAF